MASEASSGDKAMCGIFGIMARGEAPLTAASLRKSLSVLAKHSQSRGRDSSGLAFRDARARSYKVFKGAVPINFLFRSPQVRVHIDMALASYAGSERKAFTVFGHSRLVTNGSQLQDENNQPVLKNGVIGIHNGIVVNDADLWAANPDLRREHEIDTEVLLALVRKRLEEGHSLPTAIARVEAELEGTVSTAMFFDDRDALMLATNNGSLYTLTNDKDLLFFASEQYALTVLAEKLGVDQERDFEIRQLQSWSGLVLSLNDFSIQRFEFDPVRDEPASSPDPHRNGSFEIEQTTISNGKGQSELVLDVAHIARAPEASRHEAMLEFNHERIAQLERCSKCILPETFPFIHYDEDGVCNYCKNYKIKNQPKPLDELLALLEPYRRTHGEPDCIVPFSGGRDSTFALHVIKTELGLNPIAFTYDWGMVTDLGRRNIARACGKLGVENIIVAADIYWKRQNIRKNITAWLHKPHLGMIPLFMAGDKYFYYFADQVKNQTGIALNIWGINPLENTDFKVGFIGLEPDHNKKRIYSLSLKRQLKLFQGIGKAILFNPRYLNSSVWDTLGSFVSRSVMPHKDYFHLYDYFQWDELRIDKLLLEEYEWETAIDTRTTWRIGDGTAAFYNYIYHNVAGFSEHDTFRSNQVREGILPREDALRCVNEENRPRYATIKWYTDMVKIDYQHAIQVINTIPKLYP